MNKTSRQKLQLKWLIDIRYTSLSTWERVFITSIDTQTLLPLSPNQEHKLEEIYVIQRRLIKNLTYALQYGV